MIKKVLNFILNLIMSVLVLVLICINIIFGTIYNKEYIKEKLNENKFYDRAYSDIKEDFENYTMQSGLELEILDGLISKEKVFQDINKKIDSIYSGKKVEIETDSIRNELDSRINSALEKNNRIPSDSEKLSITKYEDAIIQSYESGILYGKTFSIENNYLKISRTSCITGIIIISIILILINKSFLKYISCIGVNLLFSGILCSSLRYLLDKRIMHILILDKKFSNFLVNTLLEISNIFYENGMIFIVVGVLFIVIGSLEKFKKTIENKEV